MSNWTNIQGILRAVSEVTDIPQEQILSKTRTKPLTWCRFLAVREIRSRYSWWTMTQIQESLGMRSHQNAIHALRRAKALMADPDFRGLAEKLTLRLSQ